MLPCTQDFDTTLNVFCSHLPNRVNQIPVCAALQAGIIQLLGSAFNEKRLWHLSLNTYFPCDLFAFNMEKISLSKSHLAQKLTYSFLTSNGSVLCSALDLESSCKWTSSQQPECGGGGLGGTGGMTRDVVFVSSPDNCLLGECELAPHFFHMWKWGRQDFTAKCFGMSRWKPWKTFVWVFMGGMSALWPCLYLRWRTDKGFLKEKNEGEALGFPVCGINTCGQWELLEILLGSVVTLPLLCPCLVGKKVNPHSSWIWIWAHSSRFPLAASN